MLDNDPRRYPSSLPIVDPLLQSLGLIESEELREGDIASGGGDQSGALRRIHDADLNAMFNIKSNEMCNTVINGLFRISGMSRDPQKPEGPIDRVLRWAKDELGMNQNEFAERMGISAGRLTNWKRRGMPPREYPKGAEIVKHTLNEVLGIDEEIAQKEPVGALSAPERQLLHAYRQADDVHRALARVALGLSPAKPTRRAA